MEHVKTWRASCCAVSCMRKEDIRGAREHDMEQGKAEGMKAERETLVGKIVTEREDKNSHKGS